MPMLTFAKLWLVVQLADVGGETSGGSEGLMWWSELGCRGCEFRKVVGVRVLEANSAVGPRVGMFVCASQVAK